MHGLARLTALALAAGALAAPAAAQSDVLLQLRSGSPPGDRFRVDSAGGVVAMGSLGIGIIPATGPGYRMMWHPFKAAFRAGSAAGGTGDYWDDAKVGFYSWAGGNQTTASNVFSFAMGNLTVASGQAATALGYGSTASGTASTALGSSATASGTASLAAGLNVTANANYAFALGRYASANGQAGSFTWGDGSTTTTLNNSAPNSFQVRASGGVRLYTNASATTGVSLNGGGSSWIVISDRSRKHDFAEVDGEDLLLRLRAVPVTTWRYRDEEGDVRHIGPMAQDWHAAFGFSDDETTINMSDLDGVNLAAVRALERRTAELQAQLAERDARVQALEARLAEIEALLRSQAAAPAAP
jgi:trimeric autotransporter adhesin